MRLLWIVLALALVVIIPFSIWGATFDEWFTGDAAVAWVQQWGAWGGAAIIALLIGDLFLPIPSTAVMSAAGYLYGLVAGGLLSAAGSFLSGLTAYGLCRAVGHRAAVWLAGERDLARGEILFRKQGGWIVAISRWLPVLPEVTCCMAGLTRMPVRAFVTALACGALPTGFAYAAIGAVGKQAPLVTIALSAAVPVALWFIARRIIHVPKE